ncbi:MAG: hypothetical protein PHF67_04900 [Candidatus Nanoarchaeia archaeon]|nr:hypothetical protein [Candidatus Nanoarchaeia archaeon]
MKKVCKDKDYLCDMCELQREGNPYVVINTHSYGDIKICSEPCFRVYLKEQERMLSDLNVYIDEELLVLVEKLTERADYEFVLELLKKRIEKLRYKMVENHYTQLEQNAKQVS